MLICFDHPMSAITRFFAPPGIFSTFVANKALAPFLASVILALLLGDPCVTLGSPLGHLWVTQAQSQTVRSLSMGARAPTTHQPSADGSQPLNGDTRPQKGRVSEIFFSTMKIPAMHGACKQICFLLCIPHKQVKSRESEASFSLSYFLLLP